MTNSAHRNAPSVPPALCDRYARSQARIQAAFALAEPADPPIIVWPFHYIVCGTNPRFITSDLFDDPARLVEFQVGFCRRHLEAVDDDFQPYLTPYYGTGILASAFGCRMSFREMRDPSVEAPCLESPEDVARMRMPDPSRDGLMPRVLETAAYMRGHGPYPVSLTDTQSPLDELILMTGHERLYLWMYDEPGMVHDMFDLVTEALIQWVKAQKAVTGEPLTVCYGEQGVWVPPGCGVWLADDEAVNLPPQLYEEFIVPCYSRIFEAFGGGVLHFCGSGAHLGKVVRQIRGLRAINTGPMGQAANFARLQQALDGRVPLIYQEMSPAEPEVYFGDLLNRISLRGVVFAPQVCDLFATASGGGMVQVEQDRVEAARRIHQVLKEQIARKRGRGKSGEIDL